MFMAVVFAVVVVGAARLSSVRLTHMGRARSKFATNGIPTDIPTTIKHLRECTIGKASNFVGRRAQ